MMTMATVNLDLPSDAASSWDYSIVWRGRTYAVRFPTAIELARVLDTRTLSQEQCARAQVRLLHELTDIAMAVCEQVHSDTLNAFFDGFSAAVVRALELRNAQLAELNRRIVQPTVNVVN